jgi:hypothetical protein
MTKNKLNIIWKIQKSFHEKIKKNYGDLTDEDVGAKYVLHMHSEVNEILEAIGGAWKTYKYEHPADKQEILKECVDLVKLTIGCMCNFDITEDEFFDAFIEKSRIMEERLQKENDKKCK